MNSPVKLEAGKWSQLPDFIERYNDMVQSEGGGVGRIFGYASIIGNHSAEKPAASADLPNETARVSGMEVAMNVYATGQHEFRGTRDLDNGVFNVGLYAGMEPALTPDGYSEGLNITVAPQDAAQSFSSYIKREIGNPPAGQPMESLLAQGDNGRIEITEAGREAFAALKDTKDDDFGLYKLQAVESQKADGSKVPALTVSTNENSPFSAIGLSPKQAAHYILDGQGYSREVDGRMLGGSALDYFKNTLEGYEQHGLQQPRIRAIAGEVVALAESQREFDDAVKRGASLEELSAVASKGLEPDRIGDKTYFLESVTSRKFDNQDLVDRGSPSDATRAANNLPKTAAEKGERITALLNNGDLDMLRGISGKMKAQGVSAPQEAATIVAPSGGSAATKTQHAER